jgi:hypothetical protein
LTATETLAHLLHAPLHLLAHLRTALTAWARTACWATTRTATHLLHALLHTLAHLRTSLTAKCTRIFALATLSLPFATTLSPSSATLLSVQRDSEQEGRCGHQNRHCFHINSPIVRGNSNNGTQARPPTAIASLRHLLSGDSKSYFLTKQPRLATQTLAAQSLALVFIVSARHLYGVMGNELPLPHTQLHYSPTVCPL